MKRVYIHTQREDRDKGGETWERECERGITLQSMHMTANAHDLIIYARVREREMMN